MVKMFIKENDYKHTVNLLLEISKLACEEILKVYKTKFTYMKKSDESPLTLADINSNNIITKHLTKNFVNIPIISEENDRKINYNLKEYFLIDPLDGTKEFLKKNDEFTVNIALIQNKKPVIGVVSLPVANKHFYTDGFNSFVISNLKKPQIINSENRYKRLKVLVSRSHLDKNTQKLLNSMQNPIITKKGSSVKLCLIASGESHLYVRFGNTMEWDTAAGHAILKNAGANIYDHSFKELSYNKKKFLNSFFFACSNLLKKEIEKMIIEKNLK